MVSSPSTLLVLTNLPDQESAKHLASKLVADGVAACVNILSSATSVYRWQGDTVSESEVPMLIKTISASYEALQEAIVADHPYELPEIIALPVQCGLPSYLSWVAEETQQASSPRQTT